MPFDFVSPACQTAEEDIDPFLHQCLGPQSQVTDGLLSGPAPDRLICVEVRTLAKQAHQLYAEAGAARHTRTASPGCADALSQITFSGPEYLSFSSIRKAAEVLELLLPSSSIHSTSPVSRHTAE